MSAHRHFREPRPQPAAGRSTTRLRQITVAAGAALAGLLALAAAVPAAAATILTPDPGGFGGITSPTPAGPAPVRIVTVGGTAGWQIALIALGAAALASLVAVRLDRSLTARKTAMAQLAPPPGQPQPDQVTF